MVSQRELKYQDERFLRAIQMIAPGTALREGLSYILQGDMGGLVVLGDSRKIRNLCEGGFRVNSPFIPTYLYELSKMDGAIILDQEAEKIVLANVLLVPDHTISTGETGMRHQAAQRLAKQAGAIVIAISQRRTSTTLFVGDIKHMMDSIPTLLNKASQALQTLERYVTILDRGLHELSISELEELVTIYDVVKVVQRTEMVERIIEDIERYLIELGVEGRSLALQLEELKPVVEHGQLVVRDYYKLEEVEGEDEVLERMHKLSAQELLNLNNITNALGYGLNISRVDGSLVPRGYRLLTQTRRLPKPVVENLVSAFGDLRRITQAPREKLIRVEGVGEARAKQLKEGLKLLRNQLLFDLR